MMKFKTVIYPQMDEDQDDVKWEAPNGSTQGFGFMDKKNNIIHVITCPKCHNENYLAQPICAWCGFNPNPESKK